LRRLFLMSEDYKHHGLSLQKEIAGFLANWYSSHVLDVDRKYISYMENKGIK
jgi:hemerythrin